MIVKVVERQLTWKDTGRPLHQFDVYHATKRSENVYRNGQPRSFGPRMITTKYPWNFCLHRTYTGNLPLTVTRFILGNSEDVTVETEYREHRDSQSGTVKVTTYTLVGRSGGYTKVFQPLAKP